MSCQKYFSKKVFFEGIRDGIPIGLGYFAVAFALGINVKNAGLSAFQGFLMSLLCNASAGEYMGIVTISEHAAYISTAVVTLVTNARYMLMSCALSQRLEGDMPLRHRLIMGNYITDELFGICVTRSGYLNPYYMYGAVLVASPCWAIGTALGAIAGQGLPQSIVSALSVALFGMFLAVIIPPSRKSRVILSAVAVTFAVSFAASRLPVVSEISSGTRTIVITIVISAAMALLFPNGSEQGESR